ncbi:MAG: efflux RND transporter periplasmic adaptor subunit [Perlucidibaca sp.]
MSRSTQETTRAPLWRRPLTLAAVLAALAIILFAGRQLLAREEGKTRYQQVTVTQGDIDKTVTALGSLKPRDYVDVGTQVSGQLRKVHVKIGERVSKGQLIAEIDPTVYATKVSNDRANLDNLRAQLRQQEAELVLADQQQTRNHKLLAANAASQDEVDQADANARIAMAKRDATQAQIKAAEATLAGDVANLGYTRIYAPIAGTIASQTSLEGQTVNASQSAPVIVQVANLDTMTVWAQVAEADIVRIHEGMPAYFTTLGMPERKWRGSVRQVQPTPETVNDVVLYNVLIDVDNSEGLLMPTMTVQVFFELGSAHGVPTLPLSALRQGQDGSYQALVQTGKTPQWRRVSLGLSDRQRAQITSGLAVGDRVLVAAASASGQAAGRERGGPGMGPRL